MRTPMDKAIQILRLLLEGNSVRSTERLTGVGKRAILKIVLTVGERCADAFYKLVRNVPVENVQVDELWSFIGCKEKTRLQNGYSEEFGDCYTFLGVERDHKMILSFAVGKRDHPTAQRFAYRLKAATLGNAWQLSTDGWSPYRRIMPAILGHSLPFAQVVKVFTGPTQGPGRYSPAEIIDLHVELIQGNPDLDIACTSHVERSNLTVRMTVRRFTRLTNAHSKSPRHHDAAVALFVMYYNFCRVHSTIKTTPAVAAGVADHVWMVKELVERTAVAH
jgi:IS1 family transposase